MLIAAPQTRYRSIVPSVYFKSILQNLFTNAIKYRSKDRLLRIAIHSYRSEGQVVIAFGDNGLGIDLKKHGHRLFKMYQQLHEFQPGKGLGLFIVKSQMEALGGRIEVKSQLGVGTTFYLYFPDLEYQTKG